MSKKKVSRLRRAKKARMHIRELEVPRLSVFRTPRHIYAQIISAAGDMVQASASSLDASVRLETRVTQKMLESRQADSSKSERAWCRESRF